MAGSVQSPASRSSASPAPAAARDWAEPTRREWPGDAAGHAGVSGAALDDLPDGGRGQARRRRVSAAPDAAEQCAVVVAGAVEPGGAACDGGGAEVADVAAAFLVGLAARHGEGAGAVGHAGDVGDVGGGGLDDAQQGVGHEREQSGVAESGGGAAAGDAGEDGAAACRALPEPIDTVPDCFAFCRRIACSG